jgi:hypothetical protein
MQLRMICCLIVALAATACGTASDSTGDTNESLVGTSSEERKQDGGRHCRPTAPGERSPCANGDPGSDHGRSDAGKGHGDGDDDDDDAGKGKKDK